MDKNYPTLGCCGLDCGLCPRYYTNGSSRCPGCGGEGFKDKHPSCSFLSCCNAKKGLEVCAQCAEYPCSKFNKETGQSDSFISHRMVRNNQNFIGLYGIDRFIDRQKRRIRLLETMLERYDDGRSKSFYCLVTALLPPEKVEEALTQAEMQLQNPSEKMGAMILKEKLNQLAIEMNVELKLRKG